MQNEIDLLLSLQELEITLDEAKILHDEEDKLMSLESKIKKIRTEIEQSTLNRYDRLSRHGLGVVSVINTMC
ncbi:MAG: hypothetical protein HRT89_07555, partial [Lentisphaeria bacterium]|nr:hypothetical protein [Lentisphaeria bacterium]NQZ67909.1 hypothetical protein [Lentisphaeria bacterium]